MRTHHHMRTPLSAEQPSYLQETLAVSGVLGWWYRLAAPQPPADALPTLKQQEVIRRGRLASLVLLVQLVLIEAPVVPVVAQAPNHGIVLPWLLGCLGALCVAFFCNKRGSLTTAGILMVASIEITVGIKILTVPGGVGLATLPQFDILLQPVLIAVVLLPAWSALAVAGLNIVFVATTLIAGPHAPDLGAALQNPTLSGDLFAVPIMGQFIVATVACLIVSNLLSTLKRANRAEAVAALEHAIAQNQAAFLHRNQELEAGITAIVTAIRSVANTQGPSTLITLPTGHILWPVAQQLNHFLERYQRARTAEARLDATLHAATELINELTQAAREQRPVQYPPLRGTPLDAVVFALSGGRASRGNPSGDLISPARTQGQYPA
jgi:hypothetical protein